MTDWAAKAGLLVMAAISMVGCTTTAHVQVEQTFPTVVAEPRQVSAAIVMDQTFRTYQAFPLKNTDIAFGTAQVDLWGKAFRGLFQQVEVVSAREEVSPDTELVIIPSVQEVQLSTPSQSYLNVFEVWIKFRLDIETPDGVPIDSWFLPAYGKTPDSALLSRTRAIEGATVVALRDAGAKLILDFYRIPAVHVWFEQRLAAVDP
ncbi:MAG TPA: hypothetical protein VJ984_12875 [Xanthomonadales bacterium]|nr:hypothetical protein [Xanthomonadales bacterium]